MVAPSQLGYIEFRRNNFPPFMFVAYWRGTKNPVKWVSNDDGEVLEIGVWSSPQRGRAQIKKLAATNKLV